VLAWLTYRCVERPIRSGQWGGAKTALAGTAGVTAAAVLALGMTPQLPKDILALTDVFGMTDSCLGRNREIIDLLASAHPDVVLLHAVWVVSGPDELRPLIAALRSIGVKHWTMRG